MYKYKWAAAEDLSITRIAGLTWDQWNARLAMPLLPQFHDGVPKAHSLMFPTDLSIVSAAIAAKSYAKIDKHASHRGAVVEQSSQPLSSTASENGDNNHHSNQPKVSYKFEHSLEKQHLQLQFSGDVSVDNSGNLDGGFACPECGRMYKLKSSLRNHLKWECGKDPQFQCPFCVYRAKQKMHIGRHMERMHKEKFIKIEGDQIVECQPDGRAIDLVVGSSSSPSTDANSSVVSEAVAAAAAIGWTV